MGTPPRFQRVRHLPIVDQNWKREYMRTILDGTSWELEIAHNGRSLRTYGCNAYPESGDPEGDISYPIGGQFDRFIQAISCPSDIRIE